MSNNVRRSVAFIGSECHPFVKTGGLGDVMYALPRVLAQQNSGSFCPAISASLRSTRTEWSTVVNSIWIWEKPAGMSM